MKKSSIQKSSIKKFIITDPSLILDSSNNSFKNYKAKAWKQGGEVNRICLINRKDGGRAKLHRLAILQKYEEHNTLEINDRTIIVKSGMLCIASANDGWDNEQFGATFETLEEAIEFFPFTKAILVGFDSKGEADKAVSDWAKTFGDDVDVEHIVDTVEVAKEFLKIPCYNPECPYANIVNGICTIKVTITDLGGEIDIAVKCEDEAELKQKMDCVRNYMFEETGLAGIFKRGG